MKQGRTLDRNSWESTAGLCAYRVSQSRRKLNSRPAVEFWIIPHQGKAFLHRSSDAKDN